MKITLDTNVLARVLVDDPAAPAQCTVARKALAGATVVLIAQTVQIELCWVLETAFGLRHAEIVRVLDVLRAHPRLQIEHRSTFEAACTRFSSDTTWGFADCMIATAAAAHDAALVTFDKRLARLAGVPALR